MSADYARPMQSSSAGLDALSISFAASVASALFGRRLSILIFHRVHAEPDPLFPREPDAARFRQLMRFLARSFRFISMAEAVQALDSGNLPSRALVVTFDDGYADNLEVASPILCELGIPACFFVASGFMDGGMMWNDRVIEAIRSAPGSVADIGRAIGETIGDGHGVTHAADRTGLCIASLSTIKHLDHQQRGQLVESIESSLGSSPRGKLMMTPVQLRSLRAQGMAIGAHTVSHPILASLDEGTARREIEDGKAQLEQVLGERLAYFAYPNGKPGTDYHARDVALVRAAGFDAAVSTAWGVSAPGQDIFQLPRFTPWDRRPWTFGCRLVANSIKRRIFAHV